MVAAKNGHLQLLTELLKRGANISAAKNDGATALMIAVCAEHLHIVEYLLNIGASVAEQFNDGDPCTITDPSGMFVNRLLEVGMDDMEVCFEWETCTACTALAKAST